MKNCKWLRSLFLVVSILTVSTVVWADDVITEEITINTETSGENETEDSTTNSNEKISGEFKEDSEQETSKEDDEETKTISGDEEERDKNDSGDKQEQTEVKTDSGDQVKNDSGDKSTSTDTSSSEEENKSGESDSEPKVKKYKITTKLEKGGKITPENPEVVAGQNQRFVIVPFEKYKITDVIIDGKNVGSVSSYTIKDINEDHTIEVKFLKIINEASEEEKKWNNPFTDVKESDWFYDAIRYVNKHELFKGISNTEFAPNSNITRGMLVTVLFRFSNAIEYSKATFDDVAKDAYYSEAVAWASKTGIVNGIGNNQFAPDTNITRQDLATIIYRYAKFKGKGFALNTTYLLDYIDRDSIAEYAYEAICWGTTTKVMNGKENNRIDPTGLATRAEVATIMQRLVKVFE